MASIRFATRGGRCSRKVREGLLGPFHVSRGREKYSIPEEEGRKTGVRKKGGRRTGGANTALLFPGGGGGRRFVLPGHKARSCRLFFGCWVIIILELSICNGTYEKELALSLDLELAYKGCRSWRQGVETE